MSQKPQFYAYEGWGETARKEIHYSQTVRRGNMIQISGQGGWSDPKNITRVEDIQMSEDIETQIDQAFANVELALKDAGGKGWSQVYNMRSLHVGMTWEATQAMTKNLRKYCPDNPPCWTQYGVAALGLPAMKVEIEVEAYDG